MPLLLENKRNEVLEMLMVGATKQHYAFGCSVSTVTRLAQQEQVPGSVRNRRRTGQSRKITRRQDLQVRVKHL